MKMKRSIALLIALAMSINMFGVTAFAQDAPAETGAAGAQITGQSDGQPGEGTTPASTPADEGDGETTPASTPAGEDGGEAPPKTEADGTPAPVCGTCGDAHADADCPVAAVTALLADLPTPDALREMDEEAFNEAGEAIYEAYEKYAAMYDELTDAQKEKIDDADTAFTPLFEVLNEGVSTLGTHTHGGIIFEAWTHTDYLPTDPGNYYLAYDVGLASSTWLPRGTVNLCLNGKTISKYFSDNSDIIPKSGCILDIWDYEGGGKIICNGGSVIQFENTNVNVTLHGGTLIAQQGSGGKTSNAVAGTASSSGSSFTLEGGTVKSEEGTYSTGPAIATQAMTVNLNGGTVITDANNGVYTAGGTINLGGTAIDHDNGFDSIKTTTAGKINASSYTRSDNLTVLWAGTTTTAGTVVVTGVDDDDMAAKFSLSTQTANAGWKLEKSGKNLVLAKDTFTATVNLQKDDEAWVSSGKTLTLRQSGAIKYTLTDSGSGVFTCSGVASGTYDVYADGVDTGVDVTGATAVTVNYHTVTEPFNLSDLVTKPTKGGTPQTTFTAQTQYTGTITWSPAVASDGKFLGGTAYTATVTLTPTANYTFTGVAANAFSYTGATVTNAANSGTVTIAFPATAAQTLSGIALNTAPTKTEYTYGEAFAPAGLVLDLTYDDGTTGTVTYSDTNKNDFAFTPAALTVATTSVGVTYGGKNVNITGITVNKAPLTWDVSGLTAKKPYDGTTTATVAGTLKLSGVVAGDDVGLNYKELTDNTPLTGSYADKEIGTGKTVTVTVENAALTGAKSGNYTLPSGEIKITNGQIAAPLPTQPTQPADENEQLKLTVEDGIPMVPAALKNDPTRDTPAKIESALKAEAAEALPAVPAANIITMDIELWYSNNGGANWTEATADKFPTAGVTVVVPYTELSLTYAAAQGMDFTVLHMISAGSDAGRIEYPPFTLTQAGVQFTVHSLSPVTIAYKPKAATAPADNGGGNGDNGDNNGETTAATQTQTSAPDAAPGKFTVNAWVNVLAGGTLSPMGNTTYTQGKNLTYTITPAAGYRIAKVTVDGVDVGAVSSYTFNYLNRNHEIGAYFEKTAGKAGTTGAATGSIIPQTADSAPLMLYLALLALAAIGLCVLVPWRRKKQ